MLSKPLQEVKGVHSGVLQEETRLEFAEAIPILGGPVVVINPETTLRMTSGQYRGPARLDPVGQQTLN
jgi:hypothetical protein